MNSDISYIRAYIVPVTSTDHRPMPTSNTNGTYPKLLQRRQELCSSARRSLGTAPTFDQTITFIEQLKRNQHRSVADVNRLSTQTCQEAGNDRKTLTPQELCYQLNLKLEYLIRTRVIERHRVINQRTILPPTNFMKTTTPRENCNRTTLSYLSQSREKNVVSSSTTTMTNTTIVQDESVEKDSLVDNDEAFEEMVEEEALTFLQQQP